MAPSCDSILCSNITSWVDICYSIYLHSPKCRYHFPGSLAMAIWARLCPSDVGTKKQGTMQNPFWNKWWPQQCIDLASSGSRDSDFNMVSVATVQHSWGQKSLPQHWSSAPGHDWGIVPVAYSSKAASPTLLHILLLPLNLPKVIQKFL